MTSEVGPGFSRSWLPGMWGQWVILSYAHFSRPRQLGELHLSEKTLPRLGCGYGPLGSAWTSFPICKCTLRASGPWEAV